MMTSEVYQYTEIYICDDGRIYAYEWVRISPGMLQWQAVLKTKGRI